MDVPESPEMLELCRAMAHLNISEPLSLKDAQRRMILGIEPDAILRTELKLVGKLRRGRLSVEEVLEFAYFWKRYCIPLELKLSPPQPTNSASYELLFLQRYLEKRDQAQCSKEELSQHVKEMEVQIKREKESVKKSQQQHNIREAVFIEDPFMTLWTQNGYVVSCIM